MDWSSFPPDHKKSLYRGLGAYLALAGLLAGWIWMNADKTVAEWNKRIPTATATIKDIDQGDTQGNNFSAGLDLPPHSPGEGYVNIIMSDMGISRTATARVIEDLPQDITLAFSPYGADLGRWLEKTKAANRETLMLLPMEPLSYPHDDPGPDALLTRQSDADNQRRLARVLRQSGASVGGMNYMGSSLLADEKNVTAVMASLQKRAGIFVENPQGSVSVAADVAQRINLPYLQADVLIDKDASELAVRQQLVKLENLAKTRGYAVGIAQPYPVTLGILKAWSGSLDRRGVKLVPLSGIWKAKSQRIQSGQNE